MIKTNKKTILALGVAGGLLGCGAFGGGGGGSKSSASTSTPGSTSSSSTGTTGASAITPAASIAAAALPAKVTRNANGYSWSAYYRPVSSGDTISATAVDPSGTMLFVGYQPSGKIDMLGPAAPKTEATLPATVTNFAFVGANAYAATMAATPKSAKVFARDAQGNWTLSRDGAESSSIVESFNGRLFAFNGTVGADGMCSSFDAAASKWTDVAPIAKTIPTATAIFGGDTWVGGFTSGAVKNPILFDTTAKGFVEKPVAFQVAANEMATVEALGLANGQLYVGVEATDAQSRLTTRGSLQWVDPSSGNATEIFAFQNDAPVALAEMDGTLYVATRAGRVLWLDEKGALNDDAGLPQLGEADTLAVNGGALFAGAKDSQGLAVLVRIANTTASPAPSTSPSPAPSTSPSPSPAPSTSPSPSPSSSPTLGYQNDILPIIQKNNCTNCHGVSRPALTPYSACMQFVVAGNPAASKIVQKTQQGGSMQRYINQTDADTISNWIQQGAKP